jgi:alkylation response protein AidB-like acyl-CoA dehydrogenase
MDLDLNDDQVALRDGVAAMLEGRFGSVRIRNGFDRAMFDELAEAGVFSLRADGFGWSDAVVVFEQLGRSCVPGPLVGSLLFGDGRITGVIEDAEPAWVEHLDVLDELVVLSGPDARRVAIGDLAGTPSPWPLDPLTPVTRIEHLPAGETINADADERRREGATLTAALQLGIADRCTELAVAYAKERVQFDRPIAAFQAIKHLCADMLVRTEVARAAVYAAGAHLDDVDLASYADLDRGISGAKVMAGEAAIANAKAATQVYGGMGFTWEVDVHLFLKRAWLLDTHFGTGEQHADVVGTALGAGT